MAKKKNIKKDNTLTLGVISGLMSGMLMAVATEAARIARVNGHEILAKWLRVIIPSLCLFYFVRLYKKNSK